MNEADAIDRYSEALDGVSKWVEQCDWGDLVPGFGDQFFQGIQEILGESYEDVLPILPLPLSVSAWKAFRDQFITFSFDRRPSTAIDDYLNQVGMDLVGTTVDFLLAFQHATMSLYKVTARIPGEKITLKDQLRKRPPITLPDHPSAVLWKKGDLVAVRLVRVEGELMPAGTHFVFDRTWGKLLQQGLEGMHSMAVEEAPPHMPRNLMLTDMLWDNVLTVAGAFATCIWVAAAVDVLGEWDRPDPEDDEESEDDEQFRYEIDFPINSSAPAIFEALQAVESLNLVPVHEPMWFCYRDREDFDEPLMATVWLNYPTLWVGGFMGDDVWQIAQTIAELLGDNLGEPERRMIPLESELEDDDEEVDLDGLPSIPMTSEGEIEAREQMHRYLDKIYRIVLDQPLEEFGDQTPRELATTAKGQKKLVKWIQSLEVHQQSNQDRVGIGDYNVRWIWTELGIEHLRQDSLFE